MRLPWIIAAAAAGLLAGPRIRASVFARSTEDGRPRRACPECSRQVLAGRWLWCSVLSAIGRCPHCKARIGPDALAAEVVTGLVLAVAAARASSGWELAALAWLALIAVPLAFIDIAVQRLPDLLTISAFAGTLVLLAGAEGAAHQPWLLIRAVIGAAALSGFYLALWLVFPDQLGPDLRYWDEASSRRRARFLVADEEDVAAPFTGRRWRLPPGWAVSVIDARS